MENFCFNLGGYYSQYFPPWSGEGMGLKHKWGQGRGGGDIVMIASWDKHFY